MSWSRRGIRFFATWVVVVVWLGVYFVALATADPLPTVDVALGYLIGPPLLWVIAVRLALRHWWAGADRSPLDPPARLLTAAVSTLPTRRRDWGRAMLAELAEVRGRGARWRFALSSARGGVGALLWLPSPTGWPVLALVAGVAVAATLAAGPAVEAAAPGLRIFAVTFTGLSGALLLLTLARTRSIALHQPTAVPHDTRRPNPGGVGVAAEPGNAGGAESDRATAATGSDGAAAAADSGDAAGAAKSDRAAAATGSGSGPVASSGRVADAGSATPASISRTPALRRHRLLTAIPVLAPSVLVIGAVAAAIAVTVGFVRQEPSAAAYLPPLAAAYLAVVLVGCLAVALSRPSPRRANRLARQAGAGAAVVFAGWLLLIIRADGIQPPLPIALPLGLALMLAPVAVFFVPAFAAGRAGRSFRTGLLATLWTAIAAMPLTYALWLPESLRQYAIDGTALMSDTSAAAHAAVGQNVTEALVFCLGIFPVLGLTLGVIGAGLGARLAAPHT